MASPQQQQKMREYIDWVDAFYYAKHGMAWVPFRQVLSTFKTLVRTNPDDLLETLKLHQEKIDAILKTV